MRIFNILAAHSLTIDDKIRFLSQRFYRNTGYYPDFKKPRSFNEKLNWIRYNYTNFELRKKVADKLLFKEYIEEKLGQGYTARLLKVFDNIEDLNFEGLPDKFVVKTTSGFGGMAVKIVKDKNTADLDKIKFELSETLNPTQIEFGSKGSKQKIFIEEYMEQIEGQLYDYKFFCFHGEPKLVYVAMDHFPGVRSKISLYNLDWKQLDIKYDYHPNIEIDIDKPKNFEEMIEIARKLSEDFPFMRVDLYNIDGKILAGEMTFIPSSGMCKFDPVEYDYKLGECLDLGKINPEHLRIQPEFVEGAKTFIDPQIVENSVAERE